jgi:hypothetical protein
LKIVIANPNAHQPTCEVLLKELKADGTRQTRKLLHTTPSKLLRHHTSHLFIATSRNPLAAMPSIRSKPTSVRKSTAESEKVKNAQSKSASSINSSTNGELEISGDDIRQLRHVPEKIPVSAYSIALFEMFESFSSSGTFIVCTLLYSPLLVLAQFLQL